ncbi:hypothetical protein GGI12_004584 [Dipsacomyces acuminosporus]|nr:hypothetical protein GGI12_004584 [Dipsacomyces acuminosporus]
MLAHQEIATRSEACIPSAYSGASKWEVQEFDCIAKTLPNKEFFDEFSSIVGSNGFGIKYVPGDKKYVEISNPEGETLVEVSSFDEYPDAVITCYRIGEEAFEITHICWPYRDGSYNTHSTAPAPDT